MLTRCWLAAVSSICVAQSHIRNVHEVVLVTDSVNVLLFVYKIPGMLYV